MAPWTVACQAPLSLGFPNQDYWSGLLFPPPRDLPDPGIEPMSPVTPALPGGFFSTRKANLYPYLCHLYLYLHLSLPLSTYLYLWEKSHTLPPAS